MQVLCACCLEKKSCVKAGRKMLVKLTSGRAMWRRRRLLGPFYRGLIFLAGASIWMCLSLMKPADNMAQDSLNIPMASWHSKIIRETLKDSNGHCHDFFTMARHKTIGPVNLWCVLSFLLTFSDNIALRNEIHFTLSFSIRPQKH